MLFSTKVSTVDAGRAATAVAVDPEVAGAAARVAGLVDVVVVAPPGDDVPADAVVVGATVVGATVVGATVVGATVVVVVGGDPSVYITRSFVDICSPTNLPPPKPTTTAWKGAAPSKSQLMPSVLVIAFASGSPPEDTARNLPLP
jgi:hypothetical protein